MQFRHAVFETDRSPSGLPSPRYATITLTEEVRNLYDRGAGG